MDIRNLTQETWRGEVKRSKIKVGDNVVYYISNIDDNKVLRWELDMMKLGREYGINSPEVLYYEENGNIEVCVLKFIEGRKTNSGDLELINQELQKFDQIPAQQRVSLKNNVVFPDGSADELSTEELEDLIRSRVQKLCKYHKIQEPKFPKTNIAGPCVFSYVDISYDNMIYKDDNIYFIDWECCGFFPKDLVPSLCYQEIGDEQEMKEWNIIVNILKHLQINKEQAVKLIQEYNNL